LKITKGMKIDTDISIKDVFDTYPFLLFWKDEIELRKKHTDYNLYLLKYKHKEYPFIELRKNNKVKKKISPNAIYKFAKENFDFSCVEDVFKSIDVSDLLKEREYIFMNKYFFSKCNLIYLHYILDNEIKFFFTNCPPLIKNEPIFVSIHRLVELKPEAWKNYLNKIILTNLSSFDYDKEMLLNIYINAYKVHREDSFFECLIKYTNQNFASLFQKSDIEFFNVFNNKNKENIDIFLKNNEFNIKYSDDVIYIKRDNDEISYDIENKNIISIYIDNKKYIKYLNEINRKVQLEKIGYEILRKIHLSSYIDTHLSIKVSKYISKVIIKIKNKQEEFKYSLDSNTDICAQNIEDKITRVINQIEKEEKIKEDIKKKKLLELKKETKTKLGAHSKVEIGKLLMTEDILKLCALNNGISITDIKKALKGLKIDKDYIKLTNRCGNYKAIEDDAIEKHLYEMIELNYLWRQQRTSMYYKNYYVLKAKMPLDDISFYDFIVSPINKRKKYENYNSFEWLYYYKEIISEKCIKLDWDTILIPFNSVDVLCGCKKEIVQILKMAPESIITYIKTLSKIESKEIQKAIKIILKEISKKEKEVV